MFNKHIFFFVIFCRQPMYLIYKQDFEELTTMALNLEIAEKIIAKQPDKNRLFMPLHVFG